MQLCICINCFLKVHNKQLNEYCLNFTIFFNPKKEKRKKNGSGLGRVVGRLAKNTSQVTGQPVFASSQKIKFGSGIFWVRSENSDPFCNV